jgi:hypothetical protein
VPKLSGVPQQPEYGGAPHFGVAPQAGMNELILLALADEFGSNDHGSVGSDYFNREQKWREEHRLEPGSSG